MVANFRIMGIVNATPDSFFSGSRVAEVAEAVALAERHIREGADVIDIGGQSTRPGAEPIDAAVELERVRPVVEAVAALKANADFEISIDTFYGAVAAAALDAGADRINDVSAGRRDPELLEVVIAHQAPYILMHAHDPWSAATPGNYQDVTAEVVDFFARTIDRHPELSASDLWLDPGLGFGKTTAENFQLLAELQHIAEIGPPVLVGLSRKRLIHQTLGCAPEDDRALIGTTALHAVALQNGAHILRVHDVAQAVDCARLHTELAHMKVSP